MHLRYPEIYPEIKAVMACAKVSNAPKSVGSSDSSKSSSKSSKSTGVGRNEAGPLELSGD